MTDTLTAGAPLHGSGPWFAGTLRRVEAYSYFLPERELWAVNWRACLSDRWYRILRRIKPRWLAMMWVVLGKPMPDFGRWK